MKRTRSRTVGKWSFSKATGWTMVIPQATKTRPADICTHVRVCTTFCSRKGTSNITGPTKVRLISRVCSTARYCSLLSSTRFVPWMWNSSSPNPPPTSSSESSSLEGRMPARHRFSSASAELPRVQKSAGAIHPEFATQCVLVSGYSSDLIT